MTLLAALNRAIAMAEFALDGTLLRANDRYCGFLGITPQDIGRLRYADLCASGPADPANALAPWHALVRGETAAGLQQRQHRNGGVRWLETASAPLLDEAGRIVGVVEVATDVTDRLHRETLHPALPRPPALVAEATDNAVLVLDEQSRIRYVNPAFSRMFGFPVEQVLGRPASDVLTPYRSPEDAAARRELLRAGRPLRTETLLHGTGDIRYWGHIVTNPVMDAQGQFRHAVSVITDITHAKLHEVLQRQVLEAMACDHPLAVVLALMCQEVERIAPSALAAVQEVDERQMLQPLAAPSLPAAFIDGLRGRAAGPAAGSCGTAAFRNAPVVITDTDTDPLWQSQRELARAHGLRASWSMPIRAADGRVVGIFTLYYRQAGEPDPFHRQLIEACTHLCALALERERSRARIQRLTFYDTLTGLPNRKLLLGRADQAIAGADRSQQPLAVLFIDIDRFKRLKDSLGPLAGDALLWSVARELEAELQPSELIGRLSGDEFAAVLPACDGARAQEVVQRLQARLGQSRHIGTATVTISASVGIAVFPADGRDMQTLLHRANRAMHHAKAGGGRGQISFFSQDMGALAQDRLLLEASLREAIEQGRLRLDYQPQVRLRGGGVYGAEALARWHDPELGEISPTRFIPLAEECGMIGALGRWVLREACRQLAAWHRRGLTVPTISVNLSPTSFHSTALPALIADTLARHSLLPRDLTLEITENMLLDTNPATLKTLGEIHALGVRLSMDDFGTGYSSLSYLRRLPVSELKLDKSFVTELDKDEGRSETALALSDAVLRIGQSLRLTVVAEGVETERQRTLLERQGYHAAQGYLFARPLPPAEFETWITQRGQRPAPAPAAAPKKQGKQAGG
ncbi:MAG: Oxygen sensor protein DosP [Paracidovorax wautersii]|uniref:Oxygen sensor protein DosP n=1 Tax=Paracidovorax wautersii TaxID=1177982 RepID=A0A7V8JPC4_9BURK|nr:MAG: Oxygen sensor protein DosP [Paracidovorax wautersii]